MSLSAEWFSEEVPVAGSAFSLKVKRKLHDVQSPYQRVEVYETEHFGNLMTLDGMVMLTTRDNFLYHEMMSHPALFTHPNPKRVLIIGGGDCGTLREVLKHPGVQSAEQVDIDKEVTVASELYFPELCDSNNDPRAKLHFDDGIKWVRDAKPGSYDVIIVDSTDPVGPAEGLFSKQFYIDCMRALGPGGIVVQQSESPLLHMLLIKNMYDAIEGAGFVDVSTLVFPQPVYPSGWWSATMALKDGKFSGFRETDAKRKVFSTRYYNAAVHHGALAMPEFFLQEIGK